MSLIKCPECGHEVSTKAPRCPHCGVPIAGNLKRCPNCDTIMLKDVERCPNCDTPFLVTSEAPAPAPMPAPAEPTPTLTPPAPAAPTEEVTAPTPERAEPADSQATSPTPSPAAAPAKKKKILGGWALFALIVVLAALAVLIVWQIKSSREANAEAAFTLLRECNDPRSFEDFINRYPKSRHIAEVEARLEELRLEEVAWQAALSTTNPAIVRDFIDNYPTSAHHSAALHRIDTLDWREANKKNTSAGYTAYISAHDAGDFITEAFAAREEAVKREEQAYRDSIAAARADSITLPSLFNTTNNTL